MTRSSFFLISFILSSMVTRSFGQNFILGKVIDKENVPIPSANLVLLDSIKKTILLVQIADSAGTFKIELKNNRFKFLKVSAVGFMDKFVDLKNFPSQNLLVRLQESNNQLKQVNISANKPLIERKIDRLIFRVENSISAIGSNALEVLAKAPNVRASDGGISIVGRSSVGIMINSRLINLSGESLTNYLRSINADQIKEIEIISNPPSKYEAAGNSGLLNIILKKNSALGLTGSIALTSYIGKYAAVGPTVTLNYNKKKFHINSNLSAGYGKYYSYKNSTVLRPIALTRDDYNNTNKRGSIVGSVSFDYDVSQKSSIGIKFEGTGSNLNDKNERNVRYSNLSIDSILNVDGNDKRKTRNQSVFFYYQKKLDTTGKILDFDMGYLNYKNNTDNYFAGNTLNVLSDVERKSAEVSALQNQGTHIFSTKLDLTLPNKIVNVEIGGKLSLVESNSALNYRSLFLSVPVQNNKFNYKENIAALYLSAQKTVKNWSFKAGLRAENTSTTNNSTDVFKQNYTNFMPTGYINYTFTGKQVLGVSYGKRLNRPTYESVNPARLYTSNYNYEEGTVDLQPSKSQIIELNFSSKNFSSVIYATTIKNGFSWISILQPDNLVVSYKPQNFADDFIFGLSESYTFNKLKWLESNNQFDIYHEKDSYRLAGLTSRSNLSAYFSSDNSFIMNSTKTLKSSFRFFYQFPEISDLDRRRSYYGLNAGISASLMQKKFNISFNVNDIFRTSKIITESSINNVDRRIENYNESRNFRLTFSYRFGNRKNEKSFRDSSIEGADRIKQ